MNIQQLSTFFMSVSIQHNSVDFHGKKYCCSVTYFFSQCMSHFKRVVVPRRSTPRQSLLNVRRCVNHNMDKNFKYKQLFQSFFTNQRSADSLLENCNRTRQDLSNCFERSFVNFLISRKSEMKLVSKIYLFLLFREMISYFD